MATALLPLGFLTLLLSTTTLALPHPHVLEDPTSSYIQGSTLIVGGVEAAPNEFPHIVSLRFYGMHWCGGSILDPLHILTAAHCLDFPPTLYSVYAGKHNLQANEGTEQVREGSARIMHPSYGSPTTYSNDIAILRLSSPLDLNSYVQQANLPYPGFVPTAMGTVSGWGHLREGGDLSNVLMKVDVPYVNRTTCSSAYSSYVDELMVCYGESGKDSCQGDSGGPLMCGSKSTLCGIVSYGIGCARPGYPGVYTRVSNYITWINSQING